MPCTAFLCALLTFVPVATLSAHQPQPAPEPIAVRSHGDEPRALLRYKFENEPFYYYFSLRTKFSRPPRAAQAAGARKTVIANFDVVARAFHDPATGDYTLYFSVGDHNAFDEHGTRLPIDDADWSLVAESANAQISFLLKPDGSIHPEDFPDRGPVTDLLLEPLLSMFVAVPAEPIGLNAAWKRGEHTFEVTARDDDTVSLKTVRAKHLPPTILAPGGTEDDASSRTTLVLDAATLFPKSAKGEMLVLKRGPGELTEAATMEWTVTSEIKRNDDHESEAVNNTTLPEIFRDVPIELADAGAEPRIDIRIARPNAAAQPDTKPAAEEDLVYDVETAAGSRTYLNEAPEGELPLQGTLKTRVQLRLVERASDYALYEAKVLSASLEADEPSPGDAEAVADMVGQTARWKVWTMENGHVLGEFGEAGATLTGLDDLLVSRTAEPIGVGAQWGWKFAPQQGESSAEVRNKFTLTRIDGDRLDIAFTAETDGTQEGMKVRVRQRGTKTVKPTDALASAAETDMTVDISSGQVVIRRRVVMKATRVQP